MKPRVLIVDDAQYTVEMLQELIGDEFEVVGETGNGAEAVELYKDLKPDIVVMDLVISQSDGITATETIKQLDPDATVLVLSSHGHTAKMEEAAEAGADDYISKPFESEEFLDTMRKLASPDADGLNG